MTSYAELEISLRKKEDRTYAAEYRFQQPGSQAEVRLGQEQPLLVRLDPDALHLLTFDPPEYAKKLTEDFFAGAAGRALFSRVRATAAALNLPLRIRLAIAADAAELHGVSWELLLDPEDRRPLFTGENVSFARYLTSRDWRAVQLPPKRKLKALAAVANPSDLPPEQAIDAPAELVGAIRELGAIRTSTLGAGEDDPPVSLENLSERLRVEQPDILYLICHGALSNGEPYLLLENDRGLKEIVAGDRLVEHLKELARPPLLVVLASCQSAGRPGSAEARLALGPRLAEAGVSAVLAMQGDVSQETVAGFMPVFFRTLAEAGRLEYAASLARGRVRDQPDFWMPALFTRLEGDSIFAPRVIPWNRYAWVGMTALLLLLVAAGVWLFTRIPKMGGGFNVGVAEFTVQDESGRFVSTPQGLDFSTGLFTAIDHELNSINQPGALQIETRGPAKIGVVKGDTPEAREISAKKLAHDHNTTVLIYGVITRGEQGQQVEPVFYVSNLGWDAGGEVAGQQRLGRPVPVDLSGSVAGEFAQNELLQGRVRALEYLVNGLSFFYIQKFNLAAAYFQEAADEATWEDGQGKEVAYVLLGAAWLRDYLAGSPELDNLERARRAFERATAINPEYSRGYLGLGSVTLQQAAAASQPDPAQAVPLFWEAQDWLQTALDATDKPALAYVDTKAAYELGLGQVLGARLGVQGFSNSQAREYFERVLKDNDAFGRPVELAWPVGLARYYLGRLSIETAPVEALKLCQGSLDDHHLLDARARPVMLANAYGWECVALAQAGQLRTDRAIDAYQTAIDLGGEVVQPDVLSLWEKNLDNLKKETPIHATP